MPAETIPDIRRMAEEKKKVNHGVLFRWKRYLQIYWLAKHTSTGEVETETWKFPTERSAIQAYTDWERKGPHSMSESSVEKPKSDTKKDVEKDELPDWAKKANSNNVHDHPKIWRNEMKEAVRTQDDAKKEMVSLAKELVDEIIGVGGKTSGIKKSYRRDAIIAFAKHLQTNFDAGYAHKTPIEFNPKKFSAVLNQNVDDETAEEVYDSVETFATHAFGLGQEFAALRRKHEGVSLNESANVLVFDGRTVEIALADFALDHIKRRGQLTGYEIPPKVREALGANGRNLEKFLDNLK